MAAQRAFNYQDNMQARQLLLDAGITMVQPIYSQTLTGTIPGQVVNIPVRNVGYLKRFFVQITANVAQGAAETQTQTRFGISNFLSNVQFTDLSNQVRVNTTGWHLHMLASMKRQAAFGAAFTTDSPVQIGNNLPIVRAPATVTTVQPVSMHYEVPITYSDTDLRGGIFANVVNATMNLQLTVNPNFFLANTAVETPGVYRSSTAQLGVLSNVRITVYQVYIDQIPMANGGPILPIWDMSTAYLLNNTAQAGVANNQDNAISYANLRTFLSTILVYDNQGLNAGTDITSLQIQSANYTNIYNSDPFMLGLLTRNILGDDLPQGVYYFDHRFKPIETVNFGNMQLIIRPSNVAGVASQFLLGYEAFANISQVTNAGSLASM
jgi:hypothetical protein